MNERPLLMMIFAVLVLAPCLISAQDSGPSPGSRILAEYKQALQGALRSGLADGPVEAIAACRSEAPEIAAALSQDGVRVGRASHRLRNPDNAAPAWVEPILAAYLAEPANLEPRTVTVSADLSGYAEPIVLQPLCTTCHGTNIPAEVAARIDELYPQDRAVGFEAGDLRGVFWVEFPTQQY